MTITLRTTKGSELTYAELDGNFTDLNTRVLAIEADSADNRLISLEGGNFHTRITALELDSADGRLLVLESQTLNTRITTLEGQTLDTRLTTIESDFTVVENAYISLATLKTEVAASIDFADFQSRIAAL